MSIIEKDEREIIKKKLGMRVAKSPTQRLNILMKLCSTSSLSPKVWNEKCVAIWRIQCEQYFGKFKEETWVEKTSTSSFCNNDG